MPVLATTGRSADSIDNSHLRQQPMNQRPTNVESSIPHTRQRDPNNFPYEFREYPKAMNMLCTKDYLEAWMDRHKQMGDDNRTPYWHGNRPIVGKSVVPILDELGDPIHVYDEDEEAAFRAEHPEALSIVSQAAEIDTLRAENQRLQELLTENAGLRRETAGQGKPADDDRKEDETGPAKDEPRPAKLSEKPAPKPAQAKKPDNGLPPRLK